MSDEAFERYQELWSAIHDLVDKSIDDLSAEDPEEIRAKLTDEFRFWTRRLKG